MDLPFDSKEEKKPELQGSGGEVAGGLCFTAFFVLFAMNPN